MLRGDQSLRASLGAKLCKEGLSAQEDNVQLSCAPEAPGDFAELEILAQEIGPKESAFLTSCPLMPMLLARGPDFEWRGLSTV